ncbi:MAG: TonB-dependent receptor domain-containing protein [Chitinophagales bacterium]
MLRYLRWFIFILISIPQFMIAQVVVGTVSDFKTNEKIPGVNIISEIGLSGGTDTSGNFILSLPAGKHILTFQFTGYKTRLQEIELTTGSTLTINIKLIPDISELDVVVISGSLYEKKLTEETISIEVIDKTILQNTNATNLSDAIIKAPGVYMMDEQANIRGGTGFTYGAGSRVMLIVDDQILLAADRGDAKWNFVPIENVEQIEIIKGASSVLYGSSALNGVISVRTAWPTLQPETNITIYHGIYDKPAFKEAAWWDNAPTFSGINFSHRQKFEKMDLVIGGHISDNNSFLLGQYSNRARLNWKTRFHSKNNGRLTYGFNGNLMSDREGLFFLWEDTDTGAFRPFQGYLDTTTSTLLNWQYKWITIDPWLNYFDRFNNAHKFKMRFYNNNVDYSDTTGGNAYLVNLDYQFHREFSNKFFITSGFSGYYFDVDDHDLGIHSGLSGGLYFQVDKKIFDKLILNAGFREEFYKLDTVSGSAVPIFKAGLNYQPGRLTNLRLSFGQGYRFPSLVEKYAKTNLGSLYIFPNEDLEAEYGWNTELGVKRSFDSERWRGYADIAFYVTDYFEMTEFTFNFYPGEGAGFKSLNTSRARIGGVEITMNATTQLFGHTLSLYGGYNYIYPADISGDSSNLDLGNFMNNFIDGFKAKSTDSVFLSSVLKYRFRHLIRMDLQYEMKKISFGADINYYSLMENLDVIYISFIPGIQEYRAEHLKGDWIVDARVGYSFSQNSKIQFLVKNMFNRMYALRPAKYDAPRNFTIQYQIKF